MAPSVAALAKFATFTDAFLSGLVIPLLPSIIKSRVQVPPEQVQILTSILVAAYGGALVAVSPLLPLLAVNGRYLWVTVLGGLFCAAGSFVLFQFYSYLPLLLLARALQGLSAAAIAGAYCKITSAGPRGISWATPTVVQSTAMAVAPAVAGYLHDNAGGERSVFFCAYAVIILNALLWLVAFFSAPATQPSTDEQAENVQPAEQPTDTYGALSLRGGGGASGYSSISSAMTRSSRRSRRSSISSAFSIPDATTPVFGIRLFTALFGYLVVAFLLAALQSLIPLFATRQFGWAIWNIGLALVPMSGPAIIISLLAGFFTSRVPRSARFVVTLGFLICIPAFAHLGQLDTTPVASASAALPPILALISFGVGHSGDPLFREITRLTAEADESLVSAGYLGANTAFSWGSLMGPLVTGFIQWKWGWYSMAKFLGALCGFNALLTLLFLQGWIGNPQPVSLRATESGSDEESAPLLANSSQRAILPTNVIEGHSMPRNLHKGDFFDGNTAAVTDSSDFGSSVRTDGERRLGRHRRHFSIDNFSIATTAVAGQQSDQDTPQVRFQAALETPVLMGSSFKQQLGNPERRFVMREAPHAPATDALLASGSRYIIDEAAADGETTKRHVVVFEENAVPAELLERRQHHVVAINSVDGSVKLAPSTDNHAVHVTEEATDQPELPETSRRYVVVLLEKGDIEDETEVD